MLKTKRRLVESVACLFLIALGPGAFAGHESNGGNEVKSNFITWARVIHDSIEGSLHESILTEDQNAEFASAIDGTDVEPIDSDEPFKDNLGHIVNARVVDDDQNPGHKRIELDQKFWIQASSRDPGVCRLVFHEYLRVIGIDKQTDEDRNAVSYRWHDVCDYYTGNAAKNLDFELSARPNTFPVYWYPIGTGAYSASTDLQIRRRGKSSVRIWPSTGQLGDSDFGGVAQCIDAKPFVNSRFRAMGEFRMTNVTGFTGLWARTDDAQGKGITFDNMQDRGLRGTRDWTAAIIEIPVPAQAVRICFGVLLQGAGTVWMDDVEVSVVPANGS